MRGIKLSNSIFISFKSRIQKRVLKWNGMYIWNGHFQNLLCTFTYVKLLEASKASYDNSTNIWFISLPTENYRSMNETTSDICIECYFNFNSQYRSIHDGVEFQIKTFGIWKLLWNRSALQVLWFCEIVILQFCKRLCRLYFVLMCI